MCFIHMPGEPRTMQRVPVGLRKGMWGALTRCGAGERESAGRVAHLPATAHNIQLVGVNDVMVMRDALAVRNAGEEYRDGT